jgi:hypothetical protein
MLRGAVRVRLAERVGHRGSGGQHENSKTGTTKSEEQAVYQLLLQVKCPPSVGSSQSR